MSVMSKRTGHPRPGPLNERLTPLWVESFRATAGPQGFNTLDVSIHNAPALPSHAIDLVPEAIAVRDHRPALLHQGLVDLT